MEYRPLTQCIGWLALLIAVGISSAKFKMWVRLPAAENESLLNVLEQSEGERISSNIHKLNEADQPRILTKFEAHAQHDEIVKAIANWNENDIRELYQFAQGVRAGWLQSGLVSAKEHRVMVSEITQAVCERLRVVLGKTNQD